MERIKEEKETSEEEIGSERDTVGYEETTVECPECGSRNLIHDYERAELVCDGCGLVIDEDHVDRGQVRILGLGSTATTLESGAVAPGVGGDDQTAAGRAGAAGVGPAAAAVAVALVIRATA